MVKNIVMISLSLIFLSGLTSLVRSEEYPTKPIEILCPYAPGSTTDLSIRIAVGVAGKYLKPPLVVVNKPGAGGSIAAADVISSPADGYKLLEASNLFFALTTKTQKIPFNPSHLVPIANFLELKHGLTVRTDSPWNTLDDLLDYGRKNPGKLRWGHTGRGISQHLYGLLLFRKAGVQVIDIPYKGVPEQLAALLGGHVDLSITTMGPNRDHIKSGKLKYLAAISDQRYNDLPNIPCIAELGYPEGSDLRTFFGLYARKDTPNEIKRNMMGFFRKIFEDPEFKKRIEEDVGDIPLYGTPDFMEDVIKKGENLGIPIIKELGLYVERK